MINRDNWCLTNIEFAWKTPTLIPNRQSQLADSQVCVLCHRYGAYWATLLFKADKNYNGRINTSSLGFGSLKHFFLGLTTDLSSILNQSLSVCVCAHVCACMSTNQFDHNNLCCFFFFFVFFFVLFGGGGTIIDSQNQCVRLIGLSWSEEVNSSLPKAGVKFW